MSRASFPLVVGIAVGALAFAPASASAAKPPACVAIQDGTLTYSASHYLEGQPLVPGYDAYGYNYQAHQFRGSYANVYLGAAGFPPYDGDDDAYLAAFPAASAHWAWAYRHDQLIMKWNDAWLSSQDCDGDGRLDRHFGFPSYIGSGAWETNHMSGTYEDANGLQRWKYFVKIVAVPANAVRFDGIWYLPGQRVIGPDIWGGFAIIQEVLNDSGTGDRGLLYKSPARPGVGSYR